MLRVYYQRNNAVQKVQSLSQLETLEGLIWIDLQNPTSDEIKDVESHFEFKFQSRQEQLEIESSSRYFETDDEIIANNNFLQLNKEGNQYINVNRGLGWLGFPGRLGMRPEISFIEILPKS